MTDQSIAQSSRQVTGPIKFRLHTMILATLCGATIALTGCGALSSLKDYEKPDESFFIQPQSSPSDPSGSFVKPPSDTTDQNQNAPPDHNQEDESGRTIIHIGATLMDYKPFEAQSFREKPESESSKRYEWFSGSKDFFSNAAGIPFPDTVKPLQFYEWDWETISTYGPPIYRFLNTLEGLTFSHVQHLSYHYGKFGSNAKSVGKFVSFAKPLQFSIQAFPNKHIYILKHATLGPYQIELAIGQNKYFTSLATYPVKYHLNIQRQELKYTLNPHILGFGQIFDYGLAFITSFSRPAILATVFAAGFVTPVLPDSIASTNQELDYIPSRLGYINIFGQFKGRNPLNSVGYMRANYFFIDLLKIIPEYTIRDKNLYARARQTCTGSYNWSCIDGVLFDLVAAEYERYPTMFYSHTMSLYSKVSDRPPREFRIDTSQPGFPHSFEIHLSPTENWVMASGKNPFRDAYRLTRYDLDDQSTSRIFIQGQFYGDNLEQLVYIIGLDVYLRVPLGRGSILHSISGWGFVVLEQR